MIKNVSQLPTEEFIKNTYPKAKDAQWLWENDRWDGPIGGMVEWNNKRYYAVWSNGSINTEPRIFVILKLTDKQQKSEEYWHELFKLCIGEHTCYDNGVLKDIKANYTKATSKFFYTRRKMDYEELDFLKTTLVGWFED